MVIKSTPKTLGGRKLIKIQNTLGGKALNKKIKTKRKSLLQVGLYWAFGWIGPFGWIWAFLVITGHPTSSRLNNEPLKLSSDNESSNVFDLCP